MFCFLTFIDFTFNFFFFLLYWVFVALLGLSLVAASGGCSLVVVLRFLIAVASLGEHRI